MQKVSRPVETKECGIAQVAQVAGAAADVVAAGAGCVAAYAAVRSLRGRSSPEKK